MTVRLMCLVPIMMPPVPLKSGSPVSPSLTTTGRAIRPLFEEYHFSAILGLGCFIEISPGCQSMYSRWHTVYRLHQRGEKARGTRFVSRFLPTNLLFSLMSLHVCPLFECMWHLFGWWNMDHLVYQLQEGNIFWKHSFMAVPSPS